MPLDRPIPAFYCCYLLRSSVHKSSVYIGSTPNPVRRLRQHNGLAKGGAARTAREKLRPWEMACIVTGFPSQIAALQFEWAWQNPHITQHIAPEDRIQRATQKKRSGQPKRPRHSTLSLLSNLHVLLRSPSFSRWPLEIRFFSGDVYRAWVEWTKTAQEPIRESIQILQDFKTVNPGSGDERSTNPIAALPIDYTNQKSHVEIGKEIVDFEREGVCAVCHTDLEHDGGIYTICPNPGCGSVTHITCLSKHFLAGAEDDLVPIKGRCPSCMAELRWVDVAKEASLRMRGQREVQRLLKAKRARKLKDAISSQVAIESSDLEEDVDDGEVCIDIESEMKGLPDSVSATSWYAIDDSNNCSAESITGRTSQSRDGSSYEMSKARAPDTVIPESDWDDVEIVD